MLRNLLALLSKVMLLSTMSITSSNYSVVHLPFLIEVRILVVLVGFDLLI
jgi:hypothetical protein